MKRVVDTSKRTRREARVAARADGAEGLIRTISHNAGFEADNVDATEIVEIESDGLTFLGAYAVWPGAPGNRTGGWGAEQGATDGKRDAANALAAGLRPRDLLILDLEGDATREQWKAHARAHLGETRFLVDEKHVRARLMYLAGNAAERITGADLDELQGEHPDLLFGSAYDAATRAAAGCAEPSSGWAWEQRPTVSFAGDAYDDGQGDPRLFGAPDSDGIPAPPDTVPTPPPFVRLPGESNGQYIARAARHYSGDSLHTRRDEFAALLSRDGADDPDKAVELATNCATWVCALIFALLDPGPLGDMARALLGASFFFPNGVSKGDSVGRIVFGLMKRLADGTLQRAYVKWDGKTIPPDGAILAWNTPGKNDWHVGIVDESDDAGNVIAHSNHPDFESTEAGGSDNSVNTGTHAPPYLSWGRPLDGWVPPDALPLRPYVPTEAELAATTAAVDAVLHPPARLPTIVPPGAPSPLAGNGER